MSDIIGTVLHPGMSCLGCDNFGRSWSHTGCAGCLLPVGQRGSRWVAKAVPGATYSKECATCLHLKDPIQEGPCASCSVRSRFGTVNNWVLANQFQDAGMQPPRSDTEYVTCRDWFTPVNEGNCAECVGVHTNGTVNNHRAGTSSTVRKPKKDIDMTTACRTCMHCGVDPESVPCDTCTRNCSLPLAERKADRWQQSGRLYGSEQQATPDPVNHPPHYTSHPSGVECITVTEHMDFLTGNAVKYIWRADSKGSEIEDLEKAIWYLQRRIANLKKEITK